MNFTERDVQGYLRQRFQGRESFLNSIIFPIFGEERFENGFDDPVLEGETDIRDAAEKCGIKSIIRYGDIQIDLGSIHLFEITVSNRVLLKRNRVNVQRIVRRMMGTYTGAFMIFHYDDDKAWDWRFSFCCKDDKNFTESKRYTFLLGEHQPCRTAAQNFVKLAKVAQAGRSPSLNDIVTAFDVEAVSREFFDRYKGHYEKFVRYITGKYFKKENGKFVEKDEGSANEAMYAGFNHDDKAVRDYVKKLLGRIVFLHFLQKKGWMGARKGWSDGDPDFMLHLYQRSSDRQKGDFLDAVLEPLFDAALDTDRRDRDDFFDTGVIGVGKVRIPYLNGGLFTRDKADEVESAFPRDYFRDLLVFFSEYNFTIDENDPNDAEVGVDPEMLSRIFENLLEDNRDKGAYYTLKVVVDYMCRRSLTAYLCVGQNEADSKRIEQFVLTHDAEKLPKKLTATILKRLKDVKVCDPAIGSGAFPMGMLKLIYLCRIALGDETPSSTLKKEIIENNIYGVDIEKGAVDIARLRFWLALVVDEDTPRALPNLDFKIMQGNSLLENYKGVDLSGLLKDSAQKQSKKKTGTKKYARSLAQPEFALGDVFQAVATIKKRMDQFYSESDHNKKRFLLSEINAQVKAYIKAQGVNSEYGAEIDSIDPQNDKFFLWHTWFNDVFAHGGFDIVIGNPPYISAISYSKVVGEDEKCLLGKLYETACGAWDVYVLFFEAGIRMLNPNGVLAYITPNKYLSATYGRGLRDYFANNVNLMSVMDVSRLPVFESVSVYPIITILQRSAQGETIEVTKPACIDEIGKVLPINVLPSSILAICPDHIWGLLLSNKVGLLRKAFQCECRLENIADVNATSTAAEADEYGKHFADTFSRGALKVLNTGTIDPYCNYWGVKPLTHQKRKFITPYLPLRAAGVNDRRASMYSSPKIIFAKLGGRVESVIDVEGEFASVNTNCVYNPRPPYELKFLLGLFNSSTFTAIYDGLFGSLRMSGGYLQYQAPQLRVMPIPSANKAQQKPIVDLVDKILAAKKADPNADTSALESEIDQLVYRLYDLTPEEIAVIESSSK